MIFGASAYQTHDLIRSMMRAQFNAAAAVMSATSAALRVTAPFTFIPSAYKSAADHIDATTVLWDRATKEYPKPAFRLNETTINGQNVAVTENIVASKSFCNLLHFQRDTDRNDPKVLIVAPMSGHFATLLRDTIAALLPSHDVYITDWVNARDVPVSKEDFDLEDYNAYVQDFLRTLGPDTHVMAVCQPTVPVLGAISVMAKNNDPCQPLSMTLMAGPIDARVNPTEVDKYATKLPLAWFENLTTEVPEKYAGAKRKVYPGFVQIFNFMSMNPKRHFDAHKDLFNDLINHDVAKVTKKTDFYDEYLAGKDEPGKYFTHTIRDVFQKFKLALGIMEWRGKLIEPSAIRKTALLTVEGGEDDICGRGQTEAAQVLCTGLKSDQKYHYVQPGAGHYGVFSGRRWQNEISPRFSRFIRDIAERNNLAYTPAATESKVYQGPDKWDRDRMVPELRILHGNIAHNRQQKQAGGPSVLIG